VDEDKFRALDGVLDATGFGSVLDAKLAASGKSHERFLIAIKPNFMFAYSQLDPSTYTDPELVHHLVRRLRGRGYTNIRVVEAQSTYGQFFDHRGVLDVASYLGYDGSAELPKPSPTGTIGWAKATASDSPPNPTDLRSLTESSRSRWRLRGPGWPRLRPNSAQREPSLRT